MAARLISWRGPVITIALGANLPSAAGSPEQTLRAALARLEALGLRVLSVSSFYETPAWPDASDPPFVNGNNGGVNLGANGYNAFVSNPIGRVTSIGVRKTF